MTEEPDLVLLDLRLGDAENGWRVLDHLTLDPSTRHTPVILWPHVDDVLRAHAPALLPEHGTFVLTKPLKVEKLLGTIGEAFAGYPPIVRLNPQHRRQEFPRSAQAMALSPREREVADLVERGSRTARLPTSSYSHQAPSRTTSLTSWKS